jgi:hypothetical protein
MKDIKSTVIIENHENNIFTHSIQYIVYNDEIHTTEHFANAYAVKTSKHVPVARTKYYIHPGCNIPRFKFKNFCKTFNVALVKYKKDADVEILSSESIVNLCQRYYRGDYYSKESTINILQKYAINNASLQELITAINQSEADYVLFSNEMTNTDFYSKLPESFTDENLSYANQPNVFISEENYKAYLDIMNNPKCVFQNDILSLINTGNNITEAEYRRLKDLLDSSDSENTKLAMEIMANSDYNHNAVYILLLLMDYRGEIYNSPTKHHVNFKSLLKYFNININRGIDLDTITSVLMNNKLLNQANLDVLMPLAIESMNENSLDNFRVKTIEPTEEVYKSLETNILDGELDTQVVEDNDENINPNFNL